MSLSSLTNQGFSKILILLFGVGLFVTSGSVQSAQAQEVYPYTKKFIISAYYSPLPCQNSYATGAYYSDIVLNGRGTNGADGTPVYPGMVAAPKSYAFGTKMHIPGIGNVAVHDRGGAIVESGLRQNAYDRLDIWMGYGDKGLKRALNWGKRTVEVTVYGHDASIAENINLYDYSSDESIPNDCDMTTYSTPAPAPVTNNAPSEAPKTNSYTITSSQLLIGSSGKEVEKLQSELARLNYYKGEITGKYDELTAHAVYKFQQSQEIVIDKNSQGAGVYGPKTRQAMESIIAMRVENQKLIAEANSGKNTDGGTAIAMN